MRNGTILALYERLSSEDDDVNRNDPASESRSITHQRKLLFDFVKKHPEWNNLEIKEYKDDGYSGTNFQRPRFVELMSDVRRGNVAVIVVKDFSRLGRDYLDAGNFLDKIFPAYGVRFVAVNENYDSNDHIGQTTGMDVGFRNVVNEMYSRDIGIKQKSALMVRYKRGEHVSGYVFYGYMKHPEDRHKIVVDPIAAEVVIRIFKYSSEGYSTYQIAKILNSEGVLSPLEYKKQFGITINSNVINEKSLWDGTKIKIIIKDERYLGKMISNKTTAVEFGSKKRRELPRDEWVIVEGTHEAIISQELYDKANEALAKRIRRPGKKGRLERKNLFTCPYCNHKLHFSGGSDCRKYLFCNYGAVNNDIRCSSIKVERKMIEDAVLASINMIGNLFLEKKSVKMTMTDIEINDDEVALKSLNAKIIATRTERRNAYLLYVDGKISVDEYQQKSREYNLLIQDMEQKAKELEESVSKMKSEKVQDIQGQQEMQTVFNLKEFNETILRSVLDAVYVDAEGRVELSFHRKDIMDCVDLNIIACS